MVNARLFSITVTVSFNSVLEKASMLKCLHVSLTFMDRILNINFGLHALDLYLSCT